MPVEKKSTLEAIQFTDDGTLLIRLKKQVIVDGEVLKEEWHRTSITPGVDPAEQMAAVNNHLATMGFSPVVEKELTLLSAVVSNVHTEKVKDDFKLKSQTPLP